MWDMTITAGEGGPVFTVSQQGGGRSFSGPSPTRPWTDVCLAFRTGQRISGMAVCVWVGGMGLTTIRRTTPCSWQLTVGSMC